jgi:hypothetical protein
VVWFTVGMIGAGSMVALGAQRARTPSGLVAQQAGRMRRWYRRRREIRLLQQWYTSAEASTGSRRRRRATQVALGIGPLAAALAVAVLTAVAVGHGAHPLAAALLAGAVVVGFAAGWRTSAALALAANALGLLALAVSRVVPAPWPDRFVVVATLAALASVVGVSAVAHALRQPPRLVDLAPGPATMGPAPSGDELGRAA